MNNVIKFFQTNKKSKVIGSVAFGVGLLIYLIAKQRRKSISYSPELVEKLLLKMKRNYFPICKKLEIYSKKILSNYQARYKTIPPLIYKNLKFSLLVENSHFKKMIIKFENQIYSELEVHDQDIFKQRVKELRSTNPRIDQLICAIKENIHIVCQGRALEAELDLPEHVNEAATLRIYQKCVGFTLTRLNEYMLQCRQKKGQVNMYDHDFSDELQCEVQLDQFKGKLLKEHNFDFSEEFHELFVFEMAIRRFKRQTPKFEEIIETIDQLNNRLLQEHLKPDVDLEILKNHIEGLKNLEIDFADKQGTPKQA